MDTIKSFKGYGKVDEEENRTFQRKTRNRVILISVSILLLLSTIVAITVVLTSDKRSNNDQKSPPFNSIKAVCSVTRYPDSCFTSISSVRNANSTHDPEELFKISLKVASTALSELASVSDSIIVTTNDARLDSAIHLCKSLFDDAIDSIREAMDSMTASSLTESKITDIRTWLSAAVVDQETCLDGFEGTTEKYKDKFESAMTKSMQYTSNSLAIITGIVGVLRDVDMQLHRKLLWVSPSQRRMLLQVGGVLEPNITVAKDGTGQVSTINEAIGMVGKKSPYRYVIYVKKGVYEENVVIDKNKWNVIMYGDGMYDTIVVGSLNFVDGTPTFSTATFAVVGKGFMAKDMGFKNTAGPQKHQAVALRSGSDRSIFYHCYFDAYQDTLYAHSMRQFYRECVITGTVDFIFGDAAVVFQKCKIQPRQPLPNQRNIITAQGKKDPNENTGIVVQDCTITPFDKVTVPTYLGRPWKDYSTTIFMQNEIGYIVDGSGWLPWVYGVDPPATINYAEFQNVGPGSNVAGRVKWVGYRPAIGAEEAARYTVHAFLDGNAWIGQAGVNYDSTL